MRVCRYVRDVLIDGGLHPEHRTVSKRFPLTSYRDQDRAWLHSRKMTRAQSRFGYELLRRYDLSIVDFGTREPWVSSAAPVFQDGFFGSRSVSDTANRSERDNVPAFRHKTNFAIFL